MNFTIFTNGTFEDEKALYNNETKEVNLHGDYYHDKINEYINGFIQGIEYCGNTVDVQEETIYPDNKLFNVCDFYNEDYSDNEELDNIEDGKEKNENDLENFDESNEVENNNLAEPPTTNYNFRIDHYKKGNCREIYTQDILEAIRQVRNCEGDLYDGDKLIYSCLGFDFEYNVKLISEYGVKYEQDKGFYIEN